MPIFWSPERALFAHSPFQKPCTPDSGLQPSTQFFILEPNPTPSLLVVLIQSWVKRCQEPDGKFSDFGPLLSSGGKRAGRQAPHTEGSSILPLGEILVQMSDTQRHLNSDLEVVVSISHQGLAVTQASGLHFWRMRAQPFRTISQGGLPGP